MNAFTTIAADGAIKATPGRLLFASLTAGSDAATLILYDAASATGTVLLKLAAAAGTTAVAQLPAGGTQALVAIYGDISGTSPSATVVYG